MSNWTKVSWRETCRSICLLFQRLKIPSWMNCCSAINKFASMLCKMRSKMQKRYLTTSKNWWRNSKQSWSNLDRQMTRWCTQIKTDSMWFVASSPRELGIATITFGMTTQQLETSREPQRSELVSRLCARATAAIFSSPRKTTSSQRVSPTTWTSIERVTGIRLATRMPTRSCAQMEGFTTEKTFFTKTRRRGLSLSGV